MKKILIVFVIMLSFNSFAKEYYVSTKGSDQNDGLTKGTPWRTISYAADRAKSGDTVWIKAGNYGNENVVFKINGKKNKLISFIGYKNTPGDITAMYYSYSKDRSLDSNEMPLLNGGNRAKGIGLKMYGRSYILIKNIQLTNYRYCVDALSGANNLILDNIIASNSGGTNAFPPVSGGNCIRMDNDENHDNSILNSLVMNATMIAITVGGDNNLVQNCKTYADQNDINGDKRSMDYHVRILGSNNIIRGHYAEHVGDLEHTGHGLVLKSSGRRTENNLIENCDIVNINGSIEFRHRGVKYNTARNIRIRRTTSRNAGGFHFRDGASFNTVENSYVKDLSSLNNGAILFYDTSEDGGTQWAGNDNIIKNTIFENCAVGLKIGSSSRPAKISNNKILNCTFNNIENMYKVDPNSISENNIIQNTVITKVENIYYRDIKLTGWSETYNNYFDNKFSTPSGTGNISVDPQFENISKNNYRLKSTSKLIDAGKSIQDVKKDFDGNVRPKGKSHDIGAFEYQDNVTGSIKANAGEDVEICIGESVTLTASGGLSYQWSNGATTESIGVNPNTTTTYTVTVSDGSDSDIDEVIVTVDSVTANAGDDVTIDEGESATLTASGGDSYQWSTGETTQNITVSPNETKTYEVRVTKNGCEDTDSVEIMVNKNIVSNPPPARADAGEDVTICLGESVTLSASGGNTYEWSNGNSNKNLKVNPIRTTTYTLNATRGGITDSDTVTVTVENCKNIVTENDLNENIDIFPNPTSGILNINVNSPNNDLEILLINLNGSIIFMDKMNSGKGGIKKQIDLTGLAKGIYFVKLSTANQNTIKKVILI